MYCSSVFDASFVTNGFLLAAPFRDAQIVNLYEDRDELTKRRRLLRFDRETDTYRQFNMNVVVDRR